MANPFLPPSYESLGLARFADPPKDDQPQPKELISAVPREHVSALSGLTVQQILDSSADYESFSQVLEEQHALTKKAILVRTLVQQRTTCVRGRTGAFCGSIVWPGRDKRWDRPLALRAGALHPGEDASGSAKGSSRGR